MWSNSLSAVKDESTEYVDYFERCQLFESWHLGGRAEEVGVGVFDAVVVGELGTVGVRVVDGGGAGEAGHVRRAGSSPNDALRAL